MTHRRLRPPHFAAATFAAALTLSLASAQAQNTPILPLATADWTATDALGRTLPSYAQTGGPKANRWVGIFYWQWHSDDRYLPQYDMTEFLKSHPRFMDFQAHPAGGPDFPTYYWGQPLFGYYRSTDPWVIRKHLVMLADAGVDFLFLDYTNGSVYDKELQAFMGVARDLKSRGVAVPKLVFFLNSEPEWKIESLYNHWYKPGKYDDMWFRWRGKPLMMSPMPTDETKFREKSPLADIQNYFTWRPTWAFQDAAKEPTKWRFLEEFHNGKAQRPALGPDGKIEQMVVSKSMGGPLWDNMKTGGVSAKPGHIPSYDDQWTSKENARGIFFQAQWDNAHKVKAPILLVTGWNEWTASVWETPGVVMLGRKTAAGQGHIVDEFNRDFNRDLEPMRGGYGDDYYWQLVANMRLYKGMEPPQKPSAPQTIRLTGPITQWSAVRPLYKDAPNDTATRDFDGAPKNTHYTDSSARNDIALAQVARDSKNVYFHVRTANTLSAPAGKSWMILLIDSDHNPKTGWNGYDYLINRNRTNGECTIERNVGGVWKWSAVGSAPIHWSGRDLTLAIPRKALGLGPRQPVNLNFKWADNIPETPNIMDFFSKGDVAPDTRFSYRYAGN
ncbi:hypothetical protein CCAX7_10370 [Capsulimonas corticalis]|uniref:Uncharacterized protein n=1 Tax=Capsulimonas corticalis TaxID=2219043 RepID=A0A402CUH8_9BACT|nr:hypothetical protein [Capsulimonas corticalis]BDI28986.1 hypothetical protein CCAX7_10370 [Capsulimonas corticalis]